MKICGYLKFNIFLEFSSIFSIFSIFKKVLDFYFFELI